MLDIGDDDHAPITSQYFSEDDHEDLAANGLIQTNESGDLLKKLIDNIKNNHALKNDQVRTQFKLQLIEREEDLRKYKNLLNAMAALFFTNHRMKDVSYFFQAWRGAAVEKMRRADDEARIVSQKKKFGQKPAGIEIDTELANQEVFENYAN